MSNLINAFNSYGDDFIRVLSEELIRLGKDNSGRLLDSLSYDFISQLGSGDNIAAILIEAEDYLTQVDLGRNPGTYPPVDDIKDWLNYKGLDEDLSYPISKSIYKYGIEPTNVIDLAINRFEEEFEIKDSIINQLENNIIKKINK